MVFFDFFYNFFPLDLKKLMDFLNSEYNMLLSQKTELKNHTERLLKLLVSIEKPPPKKKKETLKILATIRKR